MVFIYPVFVQNYSRSWKSGHFSTKPQSWAEIKISESSCQSLSIHTDTHTHMHTHTHIHTCAHTHRRAGRGVTHPHMCTHTGEQGGVSHSAQLRTQTPPHLQPSVSAGVSPALHHRPRHPCQVQQLTGLVTGSKRPQVGPDSGPIRCRDTQESRSGS